MTQLQPEACDFPALVPVPPTPITVINTCVLSFDDASGTLSLTITWEPAQYANGMVSQYQLYIGSISLLPTESDQASASNWRKFISVMVCLFGVELGRRQLYLSALYDPCKNNTLMHACDCLDGEATCK